MASINDLIGALSQRLSDPLSNSQYTSVELRLYLVDAIRFWNILTGWARVRDLFPASNTTWYDLTQVLANSSLSQTITDNDIVNRASYYLLETTVTDQFTPSQLLTALTRRRNQFLSDTGCYTTQLNIPIPSAPIGRLTIPSTVIDIRRVAYLDGVLSTQLARSDEYALNCFLSGWSLTPDTPQAYSSTVAPPYQLQIAPPPSNPGFLDMLAVQQGVDLTGSDIPLGIPDDYSPAVLFGALADLLSGDTPQSDPARALYCESRYQQYVMACRIMPTALTARINDVPCELATVPEEDQFNYGWENQTTSPSRLIMMGSNLVALSPPAGTGVYSISLDLNPKFPFPLLDSTDLGLGSDSLDVILDYSEHLSLFKQGGNEFMSSMPLLDRFLRKATLSNAKLRDNAVFLSQIKGKPAKSRVERPEGVEK